MALASVRVLAGSPQGFVLSARRLQHRCSQEFTMTDLIGKSLGPYQILREIGRGGMAVVYEGYQPLLARRVAIKMLLPHLAVDTSLVRRFLQEARSAASLSHPNIVTIYDVVEQGGQYYIVMQHLPGQPLNRLIRQAGNLPLPRAADILAQIAAALDYAHGRGIVHRDIKPANIIVCPAVPGIVGPDDHAVLTDFGVARAAEASSLTSFGTVIGTPEYMSPEQAKGETAGPASDLYSLGIVLYEMLSGRVPFRAPNTPALLFKQVYETPPQVRTYAPDLPEGIEGVLVRALAKQPEDRFGAGSELARVLQDLAGARSPVSSPPPRIRPPEETRPGTTKLLPKRVAAGKQQGRPQEHTTVVSPALPGWLLPIMGVIIFILLGAVVALWPRSPSAPPAPAIETAVVVATPAVVVEASALTTSTLPPAVSEARPSPTAPAPAATPTRPLPTVTSPPEPTSTPASSATPTPAAPTVRATPIAALTDTPRPAETSPTPRRQVAAPVLGTPDGSAESGPAIRFTWTASGALGPGDGYAVLVWPEGLAGGRTGLDLPAVHDACRQPLRATELTVNDITKLGIGPGRYNWTVVVVDTSRPDGKGHPCTVISDQPMPHQFTYSGGAAPTPESRPVRCLVK
jgi:serine/threonine-protein kinase